MAQVNPRGLLAKNGSKSWPTWIDSRGFALVLWGLLLWLYLANGLTMASSDSLPNSLLAFHWFETGHFNFDSFRDSYLYEQGIAGMLVETDSGHLMSVYPVGTALVTLPIYGLFYLYLKLHSALQGIPLDITAAAFETSRVTFEKLAAAVITSASGVLFFKAALLKFKLPIVMLSTAIFALGTSTWTINSQGLWQHSALNFVLLCILFLLIRLNHGERWPDGGDRPSAGPEHPSSKRLGIDRASILLLAGFLTGLLPGIRPTSLLFVLAIVIYGLWAYRWHVWPLLLGASSIAIHASWSYSNFGNLFSGGYAYLSRSESLYRFELGWFLDSAIALLLSPSRGLLVFSPIVLFAIPGAVAVFQSRRHRDEALLLCLSAAGLVLFGNYCFFKIWWAGHSYGPRFLTDLLPVGCFFLNYSFAQLARPRRRWAAWILWAIAMLLTLYSMAIQAVGAFGHGAAHTWNAVPTDVNVDQQRLWQWRDSQPSRYAKATFNQLLPASLNGIDADYMAGLQGRLWILDAQGKELTGASLMATSGEPLPLRVQLQNLGPSRWFGYGDAKLPGEMRVKALFLDDQGRPVYEARLYCPSGLGQGEIAEAIGPIPTPTVAGNYELQLSLIVEGVVANVTAPAPHGSLVRLPVTLAPRPVPPQGIVQDLAPAIAIDRSALPSALVANRPAQLSVILGNGNDFAWLDQPSHPIHLSYHWLDTQGNIVLFEGERTPLPQTLLPGQQIPLQVKLLAPPEPGTYELSLRLVQEGVDWFDSQSPEQSNVTLKVLPE